MIKVLSCNKNAGLNQAALYANKDIVNVRSDDSIQKSIQVEVCKVDETLGVVFGYAIICKVDGEDYYDVQGDHIPEQTMLEATSVFMAGNRMAKVMHQGASAGQVVFGFPVTSDIAKSMDIEVSKTGFIVGMKPTDARILDKYRTGELTGFSIGGSRIAETVLVE